MRHIRQLLVTAGVIIAVTAAAQAGDVKVIAHPGVSVAMISADELKSIFLQTKMSFQDGVHAQPVLTKSGPVHNAFLKEYLGKSDAALQTYYRSLVFTGKGSMPKALGSDAEVLAYVANTKGAIGYVSSAANTSAVKTLDVK